MPWALDPETGEAGPREVTHVWVHDDTLVQFTVGGADVWTTHDHPFWNATDQEWQWAGAFDAGDMVLTAYGDQLTTSGTRPGMWTYGDAYNLTVDDIHTYFVVVGDTDVLVHSICPGAGLNDEVASYVASRHVPGGSLVTRDASLFDPGVSLDALLPYVNGTVGVYQANRGTIAYTTNADGIVGTWVDNGVRTSTTQFTVTADTYGGVVNMFPGPREAG